MTRSRQKVRHNPLTQAMFDADEGDIVEATIEIDVDLVSKLKVGERWMVVSSAKTVLGEIEPGSLIYWEDDKWMASMVVKITRVHINRHLRTV